jgi:hypothetical protein
MLNIYIYINNFRKKLSEIKLYQNYIFKLFLNIIRKLFFLILIIAFLFLFIYIYILKFILAKYFDRLYRYYFVWSIL